ncbi:ATP-binding protein [Actinomadura sp. NBRC 104425]|nr:ATP-binding protein [Actinomadura sp. NBRC 104425]
MVIVWGRVATERVTGVPGVDVRAVRRFVREAVSSGSSVDLGDVDLLTAEIATNAVRHTASGKPGGGVWVTVLSAPERVRVEIQDDGGADTLPEIPAGDEWGESGRGLLLVSELAHAWGVKVTGDGQRQVTVWFEVAG